MTSAVPHQAATAAAVNLPSHFQQGQQEKERKPAFPFAGKQSSRNLFHGFLIKVQYTDKATSQFHYHCNAHHVISGFLMDDSQVSPLPDSVLLNKPVGLGDTSVLKSVVVTDEGSELRKVKCPARPCPDSGPWLKPRAFPCPATPGPRPWLSQKHRTCIRGEVQADTERNQKS